MNYKSMKLMKVLMMYGIKYFLQVVAYTELKKKAISLS